MDYKKVLEQAVIYIEQHLNEGLSVEEVSKVTGYSYYHLNRQFIAVLGESIGNYIKKRRLANAAQKLLYTDEKIILNQLKLSAVHLKVYIKLINQHIEAIVFIHLPQESSV